ncbi:guanine nucleotide-binding protein-like NSN1 [Daucus carota subsp. sativus]|uniref:guanine nucleotide-binding protein-like NSN1 n=1 Tax=Daucus carota subsp. sativus TaxID=79200 RepID=UPI003082F20F
MPPTRDVGVPSEAKIISELRKEFNIDEVYGTESFISSLKSADDFKPAEMLASAIVTSDEKMSEAKNVVDQSNDNEECMAEEDIPDLKMAKTASGRQNAKLYATTDNVMLMISKLA